MKLWKRNVIVAAVLVLVCGGIYLNWWYEDRQAADLVSTLDSDKVLDEASLVLAPEGEEAKEALANQPDTGNTSEYFAKMRLSRQESRDSAVHLLQETISYADENQDLSQSAQHLDRIVQMSLAEASIESLILSKGYAECVAYMTEEGIDLAVAAGEKGLQETDIAVLTDIVLSQTDYELPQIRIIEVK